jgi:tetraacyldisaccharide 4'-kinase
VRGALLDAAAALYGAAWEARRRAYASGLLAPRPVGARVVSVGNLTVGGTGKTTLTLHLARLALARGVDAAVVCRRYRPGPGGFGDEERLYASALGGPRVAAGSDKRALAARTAAAGRELVLVDDGFSHWPLARDLDIVMIDAQDPWGGGRLLPAGRLREPRRALQRAGVVVVSRLAPGEPVAPHLEDVRRYAPGAVLAAGRHRVSGVRALDGRSGEASGAVRVVTATGNPDAVGRTAREAGFEVTRLSSYRDHHWFGEREAHAEIEAARRDGARVLLTAKDEVRWPPSARTPEVLVLEVTWEWVAGGTAVERRVLGEERSA